MSSKYLLVLCHNLEEDWPISVNEKPEYDLWLYDYTTDDDSYSELKEEGRINKTIRRVQKGKGQIFKDLTNYNLDQYNYIAVFDGDCKTTTGDINNLFKTGDSESWHWFQPALTKDSYSSYRWTVKKEYDQFCLLTESEEKYHYSPFVEIMCPVFSIELWNFLRPVHKFYDYISGYGLDNALVPAALPYFCTDWGDLTFPVVFEGAVVKHTKPVSNANLKLANGLSAYEEMDYCLTFGVEVVQKLYQENSDFNISTFCISLKDSKERRKEFKKHAELNDLEFGFFSAIDYRGARPDQYPQWVSVNGVRADWHEPLTPGEVGCAASHKALYELGLARTEDDELVDALVIFEDDAIIVEPIRTEIPLDADLVMLSNRWHHDHNNEVIGQSCGTEGYIITRSGMYKMLQILQFMDMPLDLIMIAHCQSMIEHGHGLCFVRNELNPVLKIYHKDVLCIHNDSATTTIH